MRKNGFTLIELLTVIVVLAIIALIATPIVTKTIENSKKQSAIESVNNIIKTAEMYFVTATPNYGRLNLLDENLSYNGQQPESGEIELNKDGDSRIYVYVSGYCVTKEYDSELYASKTSKEDCNWYATDNYETREGTTFTLNNQTVKNYLIYGNSTQEVRSGKNVFNPSAWSTAVTVNGLTIQYLENEDCFLINGTATATGDMAAKYINIPNEPNTSYVLSSKYVSGSIDRTNGAGGKYVVAYFGNGDAINTRNNWYNIDLQNDNVVGSTKTNDKSYITRFWFYISQGIKFDNYKVKIQLEKGTSATPYEKYGAMPSTEFPSEVKSTGDLITSSNCISYGSDACNNVGKYVIQVKSSGKNLLPYPYKNTGTYTANGVTYTDSGDGSVAVSGTATGYAAFIFNQYLLIDSAKTYTFSFNATNVTNLALQITEYDEDKQNIKTVSTTKLSEPYIYKPSTSTVKFIGLSLKRNTNTVCSGTIKPQLEEGTEATEYESYVEPKITNIYLDEPLRKIGEYADYIDYNNKKIVRNVKERVYTGKEYWYEDGTSSYVFDSTQPYIKNSKGSLLSNIAFYANKKNNNNFNFARSGAGYIEFNALNNGYTIETWKQYLVNRYNSGSPAKVQYDIATPIEQAIDLPNIETLNGASTLSINTEIQPSNVKLTTSK